MDADLLKQALHESGWQASFAFPTASKENIELLELLNESRAKIREVNENALMYKEKNEKLQDHINLVKNERRLTEDLNSELDAAIVSQHHLIKLAEQENWRTGSDNQKLLRMKKKLTERLGSLEDEIFLKSNELTSIKSELDCDQKLVERYLEECETDISLKTKVKQIANADSTKIKYLCSEESRLSTKRTNIRKKLDTVVSKNEVIYLRIDNAAELSRQENQGRREMLQMWQKTVAQMSNRDEDYSNLGREFDQILTELKEKNAEMKSLDKLLISIGQDIVDMKKKGNKLNNQASDYRQKMDSERNDIATSENDLLTLKKTVEKMSKELQNLRTTNTFLKNEANKLIARIEHMEDTSDHLQKKLNYMKNKRLSADELLKLMEEALENEAECQKIVHKRLQKLKLRRFEIFEEKNIAEHEGKTVEALISGSRNSLRNLSKKLEKYETEMDKLDRLIYNALLFGHQLEQRIALLEEHSESDEEGVILEKRIKSMQEQLNHRTKSAIILSSMINQFINDKRILQMRTEKIKEDLTRQNNQMDNLHVTLASTTRSLDVAVKERNELLVFYNICRYQLRRAEARLNMTQEATLGAEIQLQTLQSLTKELQEESSSRNYELEIQLRQAMNDKHRITTDVSKRKIRLDQLITRYNLSVSIICPDGDAATGKTQFIVKALEQHEELRTKGDSLDEAVRIAEEELRALENTVLVMTSLNESARSFNAPTGNPQLHLEKAKLNEIFQQMESELKKARENRRIFRASVLRFTVELAAVEEDNTQMDKLSNSHEIDIIKMQQRNEELDEKLQRAEKLQTAAKGKAGKNKNQAQLDISVQLLCDFNESLNVLLVRSIRASPFVNEAILKRAQELSDSFQLATPILIGNMANIKASEKAMSKPSKTSTGSSSIINLNNAFDEQNLSNIERERASKIRVRNSFGGVPSLSKLGKPIESPSKSSCSGQDSPFSSLRITSRPISTISSVESSVMSSRSIK